VDLIENLLVFAMIYLIAEKLELNNNHSLTLCSNLSFRKIRVIFLCSLLKLKIPHQKMIWM